MRISVLWFLLGAALFGIASLAEASNARKPYDIYYLPLEAEFYVPPSREYIIQQGVHRESDLNIIATVFEAVSAQSASAASEDDLKGLRILIAERSVGREVFITTERRLLSAGKHYSIAAATMNELLRAIVALCAE